MRPDSTWLGGEGSSRIIDIAVTLLPQPDSPTSPRVRPCSTEKETSSMTLAGPLSVAKLTDKSRTFRIRSPFGNFFSTVEVIIGSIDKTG
jgi:hypothetical protein